MDGPRLMVCPSCSRTRDELIRDDCPLCDGTGSMRLGVPASFYYEPGVVATAVRLSLEVQARHITEETTLADDRVGMLREGRQALVTAGLLDGDTALPEPTGSPEEDTQALTLHATGEQPTLFDIRVAAHHIPPHEYQPDDRPRARGLPILSDAGHPSATQMITDPADPFGDTRKTITQRRSRDRQARVLAQAVPEIVRKKRG